MDDWKSADAVFREFEIVAERLKKPQPELLRVCVRATASGFDTIGFAMRHLATKAAAANGLQLTARERDLLGEYSEPAFEGGPAPRRIEASTREGLNVGIVVYARARAVEPPLEKSPLGDPALPKAFVEMERLHDRLRHPEELSHLDVGRDDVRALKEILKWAQTLRRWIDAQRRAEIETVRDAIHASTEELRRKLRRP